MINHLGKYGDILVKLFTLFIKSCFGKYRTTDITTMKRLNRRNTIDLVKELDAFPKVPESYVETSAFGGTGEF